MKLVLALCLIFIASLARADEKEVHAHRAPALKFVIHGITAYTDTASLFHVLSGENMRYYNQKAKDLVLRRLQHSNNDTVTFTGESIPYNDSIHSTFSDSYHDWYPESALLILLKERRGTFIDAKGVRVKHFITHKEGSKEAGHIDMIYQNRANHERLFTETIWYILICPKF